MLEVAGDDADVRPEVKSVPPVLSPEPERDVFSPTGGVVLAGDRPDERRFPGPVRAEDGDVLSFADRERYGVEEFPATAGDGDVLKLDERRGG